MKKTYIAPSMDVIKMTTTQMLAGSLGSDSTPNFSTSGVATADNDDIFDAD